MKIKHLHVAFICIFIAMLTLACVCLMSLQRASDPTIRYVLNINEKEKHIVGSICKFKSDDWRFLSQMIIRREIIPEALIEILNHKKYNLENYGHMHDTILLPNPSGEVWISKNSNTEEWSIVSNRFRVPKKEHVVVFISEPQYASPE